MSKNPPLDSNGCRRLSRIRWQQLLERVQLEPTLSADELLFHYKQKPRVFRTGKLTFQPLVEEWEEARRQIAARSPKPEPEA